MKINTTDVKHVAQLANLEVAEDEMQQLAEQLSQIVNYMEQLKGLDTDNVEPTAQVQINTTHPKRKDNVEERTGSSSTHNKGNLFKVPRVITER